MSPLRRNDQSNARPGGRLGWAPIAVLLVVMSLIAAACGGDDTDASDDTDAPDETGVATDGGSDDERGTAADVFDTYNAMSGEERTQALVEAAQEEGVVVFYTASSGMDPVIEAFTDTYDIEVELFKGLSDTVLQRVTQEYEAGFYGVDVFDDAESFSVNEAGLSYLYVNDELTAELPGYDPERHVLPTRLSVYVTGWNTDQVSEDEVPATLDGFADPKWEGRIGIEPGDWDWYSGIVDYYTQEEGWTEEEVDEMMSAIAANSTFHDGHTTVAQLMLAGEFDVSPTLYTQSVDRELEADPDAPVAWRKSDGSFVEPMLFFPQGAVLMKNAPHPAAATLFVDFLITEGQNILALEDRTPTAIAPPGGPLDGIATEKLYPMDIDKFLNGRDEWIPRFDELLRGN